ncbi:hypothetical protein [Pantoea sp. A4]|uniref:hypothetical protein n=1 Tax=Pantoea sp. A4 TaxID=1225184 RepID=UPI000474F858|nr:hypothetical protein [Pantoea sp. A4]
MNMQSTLEPGFCVVQRPGSLTEQAVSIFGYHNAPATQLFLRMNAEISWAKPGQMLIIADPNGNNSHQAISTLQNAKRIANNSLGTMSGDEASFFHRHYATIAAVTNYMDKAFNVAGDAGERYYNEITRKLIQIETTYRNHFVTRNLLIGEQFLVERRQLFAQLESLLNKFSRLTLKLLPYQKLKHALNLSSRSIVHDWRSAGVGPIRGYATFIERSAKMARFMKKGGWVAIGIAGLNTTNEVYNACTTGRESECYKVAIREYSKFGMSTAGAIAGGKLGSVLGTSLCIALGVPTGGAGMLACGIVGAAAGGILGGMYSGQATDIVMDRLL